MQIRDRFTSTNDFNAFLDVSDRGSNTGRVKRVGFGFGENSSGRVGIGSRQRPDPEPIPQRILFFMEFINNII